MWLKHGRDNGLAMGTTDRLGKTDVYGVASLPTAVLDPPFGLTSTIAEEIEGRRSRP